MGCQGNPREQHHPDNVVTGKLTLLEPRKGALLLQLQSIAGPGCQESLPRRAAGEAIVTMH